MFNSQMIRTADMPTEMQALLRSYPRDSWESHAGFKDKTRQWLNAHLGFRAVATRLGQDTEAYLEHDLEAGDYAGRLSFLGNRLIGNLHGHHAWEDRRFFPELSQADPRFDRGLAILEKDHADLDVVLDDFTRRANRVIKLTQLDEAAARDEAGDLHGVAGTIGAFLKRHLGDEEDLAVPIILHHRLRG